MKSIYNLLIVIIISHAFTYVYGQGTGLISNTVAQVTEKVEPITNSGIDLFASDDPLEMRLSFNIREFSKTKNKPEYYGATLTVKLSENDSITQDIKIKARGEMRRSYCSFPPIMLKFNNNDKKDRRIIQAKGTLKLVTPCNQSDLFKNYVIKEYLIYKLFNLVTPYSFRTRLVKINYVDSNKPENAFTAYSFLIENENSMSERNNSVVLAARNLTQKNMISQDMARVAVFNYIIGNTDWSVPFQHNIKVIKSLEAPSDKAIPVVYDFDYSGFVSTIYSAPFEELPIKNVKERYYMGICYREEELYPVIQEFGGLKDAFLGTINNCEYLSTADKKWTTYYINSFYKLYNHPKTLMTEMTQTCKRF
jgi:hypothetical protein